MPPVLNPYGVPLVDLSAPPGSPEHVDGRAVIGYDSIFRLADAVIVGDYVEGYPPENALDDLTFDYWVTEQGTNDQYLTASFDEAVEADYLGVAAHDLHSQDAVVDLQRWDPDVADFVSVLNNEGFVPTSDSPILITFERAASTIWRFKVSGSSSCRIGILFVGVALPLQRFVRVGHVPGTDNEDLTFINNESEGGQSLGRSLVRKANVAELQLAWLTPAWTRAHWRPFKVHARKLPFFFAWDTRDFPREVIFGFGDSIPKPALMNPLYESVTIRMRGLA